MHRRCVRRFDWQGQLSSWLQPGQHRGMTAQQLMVRKDDLRICDVWKCQGHSRFLYTLFSSVSAHPFEKWWWRAAAATAERPAIAGFERRT